MREPRKKSEATLKSSSKSSAQQSRKKPRQERGARLKRGLLFDFDGTIYGDWRLWIALIEETLKDFQIHVTGHEALEKAREQIRKGEFVNISGVAIALAKDKGSSLDPEGAWGYGSIRSRFLQKMDAHMDATGPALEVVELLRHYHQQGVSMGLVTFIRKARLDRRLEVWKLKDYFQSTITPETVETFKPAPEPFIKAMSELEVTPRECLVIGDEPADMIGGKKAGARTVGLPCGFFSETELKEAGADYTLASLRLLPTIMEKVPRS